VTAECCESHFTNKIWPMFNKDNGNFYVPPTAPESAGYEPGLIVADDFDLDRAPDLATPAQLDGTVWILKNKGSGDFTHPPSTPEPVGGSPGNLVPADFDDDGDTDLVTQDRDTGEGILLTNLGPGDPLR
jgi:hypothetical protein